MRELPSGTVSMLFSDIEGSTLLLEPLGRRYADALDGHRQVLRAAWAAYGGTEMGTEGDSFFVVFPTAERSGHGGGPGAARAGATRGRVASGCGCGWASTPAHPGPRWRLRGDGRAPGRPDRRVRPRWAGGGVRRDRRARSATACPMASGCGTSAATSSRTSPSRSGCSSSTVDGPADRLPARCGRWAPRRACRSRRPPWSGREPSCRGAGRPGRIARACGWSRSPDPAGSGKTRLAIAVAERLVTAFPDGVFFVPLAAVTSADVMWTTIAEVLDVPPEQRTAAASARAHGAPRGAASSWTTSSSSTAPTRSSPSCWRLRRERPSWRAHADHWGCRGAPVPGAAAGRCRTARNWRLPRTLRRCSSSSSMPAACDPTSG